MSKKAILAILDGWGLGTDPKVSALAQANTPFIDSCFQNYPHTTLEASGIAVGLPFGQMGNSEVGHMNLGAGRVVYQTKYGRRKRNFGQRKCDYESISICVRK